MNLTSNFESLPEREIVSPYEDTQTAAVYIEHILGKERLELGNVVVEVNLKGKTATEGLSTYDVPAWAKLSIKLLLNRSHSTRDFSS